jgi:hypothetical protein
MSYEALLAGHQKVRILLLGVFSFTIHDVVFILLDVGVGAEIGRLVVSVLVMGTKVEGSRN